MIASLVTAQESEFRIQDSEFSSQHKEAGGNIYYDSISKLKVALAKKIKEFTPPPS